MTYKGPDRRTLSRIATASEDAKWARHRADDEEARRVQADRDTKAYFAPGGEGEQKAVRAAHLTEIKANDQKGY